MSHLDETRAKGTPPPISDRRNTPGNPVGSALAEVAGMSPAATPATDGAAAEFPGFTVLRRIDVRSGQGVIYIAQDQSVPRRAVIKVLRDGPHASERELARFEREIELTARLAHPCVVPVFQAGTTRDGRRFYATEFIDGPHIDQYVRKKNPSLRDTLLLFARVCDAIHHAHLNGVIHRDLKPSNILVDAHGVPKVLDFGLARPIALPAADRVTHSDEVLGTVPYMSPEQAAGKAANLDVRSDVYSLGVMLYELLTGRLPYALTGTLHEALGSIQNTPPTPPLVLKRRSKWRPGSGADPRAGSIGVDRADAERPAPPHLRLIDGRLQTIMLFALNKAPERRYQSAGELAEDLRRYLDGRPLIARRDSLSHMLAAYCRRNAVGAISLASLIVIIISAASISIFYYSRAAEAWVERDRTRSAVVGQRERYSQTATEAVEYMRGLAVPGAFDALRSGRRWRAEQLLAAAPPGAPEIVVVRYLLDPNAAPGGLPAALPHHAGLAHLGAGYRALLDGRAEDARTQFEQAAAAEPRGWWTRQAAEELKSSAAAAPAAAGAQP